MNLKENFNIAVIGAGTMGKQISLCAAINGFNVTLTDSFPAALESAAKFNEEYLAGRVAKGRLTQEQADATAARFVIQPDFKEAVKDADLVIEAVIEVLDVKRDVFKKLDEACPEKTIFATNSSYIVSSELACVTKRPEKICNMHFFAPALVMKLVEVVRNEKTTQETVDTVYKVCEQMQKVPVVLDREIEGFLVDRILEGLCNEAHRLADMGIASPQDIDKAVKYGLGHPMGPFELHDLTGIDLLYTVYEERFKKTGDPKDLPPMVVSKPYFAGHYGKKTGKGYYDYTPDGKIIRD